MNLKKTTSSFRYKLIFQCYKNWLKKDQTVLDIGCGNGIISKRLMDDFSIKLLGCDVRNYLILDIPFKKIKGKRLPFENNEFDVALLNDVLHHIPFKNQEELISEAIRVAKKVLIFEAKPTIKGKIADIVLNKYHYQDLNVPLSFRSINEWKKLFKKMMLKYEITILISPFWYPFSNFVIKLQKRYGSI